MGRGRPRKPIARHKLEGTFEPSRHGMRRELVATGKPRRLRNMSTHERWLWDKVAQSWTGELDSAQLRQLCGLWHCLCESMKEAKRDPTSRDARTAVSSYAIAFDRLAGKFGLNPADGERLSVPTENEKFETDERFFPRVVN